MKKVYIDSSNQFDNMGIDGINEAQRMREFSNKVIWYLKNGGGDIEVYTNTQDMTLDQTIKHANSIEGIDAYVSNHSNASSPQAHGYEIFYSNFPIYSHESYFLAKSIYNRVSKVLNYSRGIFPDTKMFDVGLAVCRDVTHVSVLHEMFFHTNSSDIYEYNEKIEILSKSVALGIYDFLGLEYKEPTTVKYRVMCGSFNNKENALTRQKELKDKGFDSYIWEVKS